MTRKFIYRITEDFELHGSAKCDMCGCKTLVFVLTYCSERYCMDCLQGFIDKYEVACEDEEWS